MKNNKTIHLEDSPSLVDSLAEIIHEQNKKVGWWDGKQCIITKIQLVNTEIAEATEGERKDLMDDHLPNRKMGEVELADALIRLLDIAGHVGWKYTTDGVYDLYNSIGFNLVPSMAGKHGLLTLMNSGLIACFVEDDDETAALMMAEVPVLYSAIVTAICRTGREHGYDVEAALHEKMAYNKTRLDHKRSSRAEEGGKKF